MIEEDANSIDAADTGRALECRSPVQFSSRIDVPAGLQELLVQVPRWRKESFHVARGPKLSGECQQSRIVRAVDQRLVYPPTVAIANREKTGVHVTSVCGQSRSVKKARVLKPLHQRVEAGSHPCTDRDPSCTDTTSPCTGRLPAWTDTDPPRTDD